MVRWTRTHHINISWYNKLMHEMATFESLQLAGKVHNEGNKLSNVRLWMHMENEVH